MIRLGLDEAFPEALVEMKNERVVRRKTLDTYEQDEKRRADQQLANDHEKLAYAIRCSIAQRYIATLFKYVYHRPSPSYCSNLSTGR